MYLIGISNGATQAVTTGGIVDLGEVYRRYDRKGNCGLRTFDFNGTSVALQHSGVYHATATITFAGAVVGAVIFQLTANGVAIPNAVATETIETATTEAQTTTIDFYILVDKDIVLGTPTTEITNIGILNSGVTTTITNVVLNIEKVV